MLRVTKGNHFCSGAPVTR